MRITTSPPRTCLVALMVVGFATPQLSSATAVPLSGRTVAADVMCRVTASEGSGPRRTVTVDRGSDDGIVPGWRGEAYFVYRDKPKRDFARAGTAAVVSVASETAAVQVTLDRPEAEFGVGDLVELRARVPALKSRSILWELARRSIVLTDNDRAVLNPYRELLTDDGASISDARIAALRAALSEVVEFVRETSIDAPRTAGRHKGKRASEVLAEASPVDIEAFLRFVTSYPGKYFGRNWKFSEVFATWVINDAPISADELALRLVSAKSPAERAAILREHRASILKDGMPASWYSTAQVWSDEGSYDRAAALADAVVECARMFGQTVLAGWGHFTRGYVLADRLRYADAATAYGQAIAAFRSARPPSDDARKGEAFSLHNRAIMHERLGRLTEALEGYRASLAIKRAATAIGAKSVGNSYQAIADLMVLRSDYAAAARTYDQCIAVRRSLDDTVALHGTMSSRARALSRMGKAAEAEAAFATLLAAQEREMDLQGRSQTLENLGDHLWRAGRYPQALERYEAALRVREQTGDRAGVVAALNGIGRLQWNLGRFPESEAAHQRALAEARASDDLSAQARALQEIGDLRRQSGDAPNALERYAEALAIRRRLGQRVQEAEVVELIASIQTDRKEYRQAAASYAQAATLFQAAGVKESHARSLHNLGVCYENAGELAESLRQYRLAAALRKQIGARDDEALTTAYIADVLARQRRNQEALAELHRALALVAGSKRLTVRGAVLRRLGRLTASMGRSGQAATYLAEALRIFRNKSVADRREQAHTLLALGWTDEERGGYQDALKAYREALGIADATQDRATSTVALRSLGWVYRTQGDSVQALEAFDRALKLAEEVHDPVLVAESQYALAALYHDQGDLKRAYATMATAVAGFRASGNDAGLVLAENATGVFDFRQGDYEGARARFERSLTLARKSGAQRDAVFALMNLGEVLSKLAKFEQAVRSLTQAEAMCTTSGSVDLLAGIRSLQARVRREWGETLARSGRAREAVRVLAPCEALITAAIATHRASGAQASAAFALTELGMLRLARKQTTPASAALAEATALAERARAKHVLWEAYWALARVEEARGNLPGAVNAMRKAVAVVEDLRQGLAGGERGMSRFIATKVRLYEAMADLLGKVGSSEKDPVKRRQVAEEALKYIALARFQVMNRSAINAAPTGDAALDDASQGYRDRVAQQGRLEQERAEALGAGNATKAREIEAVLARNDEELAGAYVRVAQQDPDFAARLKFDPRRIAEMSSTLPDKTLLMICFPGNDVLHLWLFNRDGILIWKRVPIARSELYALVHSFRSGIDQIKERVVRRDTIGEGFGKSAEDDPKNPEWYRTNVRNLRRSLAALYDVLVKPVRDHVAASDNLLVLPYGQMCYLPFEALYDDQAGAFLGSRTRIAYVTSENHLQATSRALESPVTRTEECWVAFADPRGRLGSAMEEAQEIAGLFEQSEVHSAKSGTATKAAVYGLRPDCTILHFATHGRLNSVDPNQTYLELGVPPNGPEAVDIELDGARVTVQSDGALTQLEVYPRLRKMVRSFRDRRVHLVTLSACETARAQEAPEAEVLGLPDAFTLAGAGAVLASQWSVDTYSTIDLMVQFYRLYGKEHRAKSDALLVARQSLLAQDGGRYAHPFFWAPFVLYGDWR